VQAGHVEQGIGMRAPTHARTARTVIHVGTFISIRSACRHRVFGLSVGSGFVGGVALENEAEMPEGDVVAAGEPAADESVPADLTTVIDDAIAEPDEPDALTEGRGDVARIRLGAHGEASEG
jgi:hypothetical protein